MADETAGSGALFTVERDGAGVVRVWLNRPELHNALNGDVIAGLTETFQALGEDDAARVIVLGGRGKSFCAGADLKWMRAVATRTPADNAAGAKRLAGLFEAIDACPKPVVARVHGAAIGGGTGIVAAADVAVATRFAKFSFSEVRLGLAPAVISPFVVAKITPRHARELFLTGERFDGARAEAIGLVNHVVEGDKPLAGYAALDAKVDQLVAMLLKGAPKAAAACKDLARRVALLPREQSFDETAELIARLRAAPEGQEGMLAFLQRRPASWVPAEPEGEGA